MWAFLSKDISPSMCLIYYWGLYLYCCTVIVTVLHCVVLHSSTQNECYESLFIPSICPRFTYKLSQLCGAWFHCLQWLSEKVISLYSAFMGNQGSLGIQSFGEIYHHNTGRQFNNPAMGSWEKNRHLFNVTWTMLGGWQMAQAGKTMSCFHCLLNSQDISLRRKKNLFPLTFCRDQNVN